MRSWSRAERSHRHSIGFVPTMGYLHQGHLRLVDRARELAERVVVSIFVNPLQFGPNEDLARYPRDLPRDRKLAEARGVDCLFVPDTSAMYQGEPVIRVTPGAVADTLEGAARPGHFAGVLTVVAKLFHMVEPDIAVFGRKDFQQAMLVRRMVADCDFPLEIAVAPTVRGLGAGWRCCGHQASFRSMWRSWARTCDPLRARMRAPWSPWRRPWGAPA